MEDCQTKIIFMRTNKLYLWIEIDELTDGCGKEECYSKLRGGQDETGRLVRIAL